VSKFVSIGLFYRQLAAKNPKFCVGLRYLVMSTVGGNLKKLNTGAQLQTFPYPTASKSFLYSNVFKVKSGSQTLDLQKRDRQKAWRTDKKTQRFSPPHRRLNPIPTKLGMVIEDIEHVLAPLKCLGSDAAARGHWKFGGKQTPSNYNPHTSTTPWANPTKL